MAPLIDFDHVSDARRGFLRPIREGRQTVDNLVGVGILKTTESEIFVVGLCVRATSIHEDPVEITVVIDKTWDCEVEKKIKSIKCSCPSGASKAHCCKHAMATLMYLESHDEEDLETVTCTDVAQQWGKLKSNVLERFDPVPLLEFCHVKTEHVPYKRSISGVTPELEAEFRKKFLKVQPNSEAAVFLSGDRWRPPSTKSREDVNKTNLEAVRFVFTHATTNLNYIIQKGEELTRELLAECIPEQQEFYEKNIVLSLDQCVKLCEQTVEQNDSDWETSRFGRITGSICYSVFTYSSNKNPDWPKKLESLFNSTFEGNEATYQGKMFEKDAKECYGKCYPDTKIVTPGLIINPTVPWLGYSADGVVFVKNVLTHLWECKSPVCGKTKTPDNIVKSLKYMDQKTGKLKQKHMYYGQVQLGLLLTGTETCDFTLYCSGSDEVLVDHITINDKFCLDLISALANVYFKQILPWLCKQKK